MSGPMPRVIRQRGRAGIIAAVCAVLVAAVLVAIAEAPYPTPAPTPLAHDPVPPEHVTWAIPDRCGISAATLRALVGDPDVQKAGEDGSCEWYGGGTGLQELEVNVSAHHAGLDAPGATDDGDSSVAAAIAAFGDAPYKGLTGRPLTGLGDEALLFDGTPSTTPDQGRRDVAEFRTGNVTVSADYFAGTDPRTGKPLTAQRQQAGALRAAADVARALGAPAAPKQAAVVSSRPARVRTPVCSVVPPGLRDRILGGGHQSVRPDNVVAIDPVDPAASIDGASQTSCELSTDGRDLNVVITTSTKPTAARDMRREYLRRYLDARAEPPISRRDDRYFHALSGLGDEAFCAYLQESSLGDAESPARVEVRTGTVLISVAYGAKDDAEPLTREDAVNGAYAVAVAAGNAVHR